MRHAFGKPKLKILNDLLRITQQVGGKDRNKCASAKHRLFIFYQNVTV